MLEERAFPVRELRALGILSRFFLQIEHLDQSPVENRMTLHRAPRDLARPLHTELGGDIAIVGDVAEQLSFPERHQGVASLAELRRALGERVEHGLQAGRGAGNEAQDVGGGALLLESLGERLLRPGVACFLAGNGFLQRTNARNELRLGDRFQRAPLPVARTAKEYV